MVMQATRGGAARSIPRNPCGGGVER